MRLGVSADLSYPLTISRLPFWATAVSPTFTVPNVPALGGQTYYEQALFLDPTANAWCVVSSVSSSWTIGTYERVPAAIVWGTGPSSMASPTGTVFQGGS